MKTRNRNLNVFQDFITDRIQTTSIILLINVIIIRFDI